MTPLEEVEHLLGAASSPAQRRTVISRSYYCSYRTLVGVSRPLGFDPESRKQGAGSVHRRLEAFLQSSPAPVLNRIGRLVIRSLFLLRVKADYHFDLRLTAADAELAVQMAQNIHDWIHDADLEPDYR